MPRKETFHPALNATNGKVEEYYNKTSNSDAYNLSMCILSDMQLLLVI